MDQKFGIPIHQKKKKKNLTTAIYTKRSMF